VGTLVMKKTVDILHLVSRAKNMSQNGNYPHSCIFKKGRFEPNLGNLCIKTPFMHLRIDVLERVRVMWVLWLGKKYC